MFFMRRTDELKNWHRPSRRRPPERRVIMNVQVFTEADVILDVVSPMWTLWFHKMIFFFFSFFLQKRLQKFIQPRISYWLSSDFHQKVAGWKPLQKENRFMCSIYQVRDFTIRVIVKEGYSSNIEFGMGFLQLATAGESKMSQNS